MDLKIKADKNVAKYLFFINIKTTIIERSEFDPRYGQKNRLFLPKIARKITQLPIFNHNQIMLKTKSEKARRFEV